jgi:hypothetical protein
VARSGLIGLSPFLRLKLLEECSEMRGDGGRSARRFASVDEVQTGCINIDYPDLIAFATQ